MHNHEGENTHLETGSVQEKITKQILCYWESGGDNFINYHLPMHCRIDGHHFGFQPACSEAMVTKIVEDHYDDLVDLYVSVNGGSGRFTVYWATWDIVDYRDTYKEYNDQFVIQLSEGAYHVRVTVVDKLTGVVSQAQNMVFVHAQYKNITVV